MQKELNKRFPNFSLESVKRFIQKNAVALIAFSLALITCFFIPPDEKYLEYFADDEKQCMIQNEYMNEEDRETFVQHNSSQ